MDIFLINELESSAPNPLPNQAQTNTQNITQEKDKIRIDEYLAKALQTSKSQITNLIKKGLVCLNDNEIKKGGIYLKPNDKIHIKNPQNLANSQDFGDLQEHLDLPKHIEQIYENSDFLILNKPPFLCVHSAPSVREATLVDWLKQRNIMLSNIAGQERAGIIHRLDKQTSGAIIIAKNNASHALLSEHLKEKHIKRYYLALINAPLKERVIIESKIARHPKNRLKMANIDSFQKISQNLLESARYAKSEFVPLLCDEISGISLIAAKLYTGRTHQIRVHLEKLNRHILNDETYGFALPKISNFEAIPKACKEVLLGKSKDFAPRVFLHAYLLKIPAEIFKLDSSPKSNANFYAKSSLDSSPKSILDSSLQKSQVFCASVFDDMLQFCLNIFEKRQFDEAIKISSILRAFGDE